MPSTFFGLNIGASALSAFQASVNTTANNIANVQTKGYTRQTTTLESTQALRITARYGSIGTGVAATEITQERDLYYDTKYWNNNSALGLYERKLYYLDQIEGFFEDNGVQTGFATIFADMFNSLDTLKTNSSDESVRNQFINQAQILCTYFNSLSESLSQLQADVNEEIKSLVQNINSIGEKISLLNKEINNIEIRGGYANELRDERAKLIDELSSMTGVETIETEVQNSNGDNLGGTNYTVVINGQILVDGNNYNRLSCVSQNWQNNQNDIEGLYSIVWESTGMNFSANTPSASGSLKGLYQLRDGNNETAISGTVTRVSTKQLTVVPPSGVDISSLDIAERGQFTINNRTYDYKGWSAEVDKTGKIISLSFDFKEDLDEAIVFSGTLEGEHAIIGQSVIGMGIPYYQTQINEFLRNFTKLFNDYEKQGVDLDGNAMDAFFVAANPTGTTYGFDGWRTDADGNFIERGEEGGYYTIYSSGNRRSGGADTYYQLTANNVAVNESCLTNPRHFATATDVVNGTDKYDLVEKLLLLQKDVKMFRGDDASAFLETLLSDVSVDTEKATIFQRSYSNLEIAIGNQRTSVSGVDEDEEALNLIKFQNAYNMASKVISVLSEMYDKLINETGIA